MEFETVQVCESTSGWSPIRVESKSEPGKLHLVLVNPRVPKAEFVCDCIGFEMRGHCRHQFEALDLACWWPLGAHREEQSKAQAMTMECPHCYGTTRLEVVNAQET